MNSSRYRPGNFILEIAAILLAIVFLSPFYLVLSNSVKGLKDILIDAASWPQVLHWSNYSKVWDAINFPQAFFNSLTITILSVIFIVLFSSMAAYQIVRKPTRFNSFVFLLLVSAMIIPFQSPCCNWSG